MDAPFTFNFNGRVYRAAAYFSFEAEPCYLFVQLLDSELQVQFGEEVTIKTDCETLLQKEDDVIYGLLELRQAIFDAIKITPEFFRAKQGRKMVK